MKWNNTTWLSTDTLGKFRL